MTCLHLTAAPDVGAAVLLFMRRHILLCLVLVTLVAVLTAQERPADTIIRNGLIVTADGRREAEILIRNGTVAAIGRRLTAAPGAREIDAKGMLVMPGGIDPHTHLRNTQGCFCGPVGGDDYTTASRAAFAGGVTTVSDFLNARADERPAEILERAAALAKQQTIADVIFHFAAHSLRPEPAPLPTAAELSMLANRGYSLKMYVNRAEFEKNGVGYLDLLRSAGSAGLMTLVHCEDSTINTTTKERMVAAGRSEVRYMSESAPAVSEEVAVQRAVAMAELTGAPIYIVHLSSERGLRAAEAGMARGLPIFVETRTIYLHLTKERFAEPDGGLYTGNPPLKDKRDQDALWDGIRKGTVHVVATDHVSFTREEKLNPAPTIQRARAGMNSLQDNLPLLFSQGVTTGRITAEQFVAVTAANPAKLFGLYPRKGTIAVGSDADIVIWNPKLKRTIRDADQFSNAKFSIFAGWEVTGWPLLTIRRGEVVYENGKVLGQPGSGQMAPRQHWQKPN